MKLTMTAAQAVTLSKAIAPAISKDKVKQNLICVQIQPVTGQRGEVDTAVQFTSTDGYRLHIVTVESPEHDWTDTVLVYGAELVKVLQAAAKADKTGKVTIQCEGHGAPAVMVTNGDRFVQCVDMNNYVTFPNVDSLIGTDNEAELPASFNGYYLSDLMAAGQLVGEHGTGKGQIGRPVRIESIQSRRCARFTAESFDRSLTFTALLMPQRVA